MPQKPNMIFCVVDLGKGKSFSEALILASTHPQYDKILFIELQVHYMKNCKLRTWGEHR